MLIKTEISRTKAVLQKVTIIQVFNQKEGCENIVKRVRNDVTTTRQ
jgi:hypothetical protein